MKLNIIIVAGYLFFLNITTLNAQEARFESLSEGIVDALTHSEKNADPVGLANMSEPRKPKSVNLKIEFDTNSASIRSQSYPLLKELCKALQNDLLQDKQITIKGHTDSDGTAAYNQKLSERRAKSVKNYLVNHCRVRQGILTVGCGARFPLRPNTTAKNKQKNRRVEIQAVSLSSANSQKKVKTPTSETGMQFKSLNDF